MVVMVQLWPRRRLGGAGPQPDLIGSDLQCLIHILKNELVMVQLKAVSLMGCGPGG